jgi:hypothetical protein
MIEIPIWLFALLLISTIWLLELGIGWLIFKILEG